MKERSFVSYKLKSMKTSVNTLLLWQKGHSWFDMINFYAWKGEFTFKYLQVNIYHTQITHIVRFKLLCNMLLHICVSLKRGGSIFLHGNTTHFILAKLPNLWSSPTDETWSELVYLWISWLLSMETFFIYMDHYQS